MVRESDEEESDSGSELKSDDLNDARLTDEDLEAELEDLKEVNIQLIPDHFWNVFSFESSKRKIKKDGEKMTKKDLAIIPYNTAALFRHLLFILGDRSKLNLLTIRTAVYNWINQETLAQKTP